MSRSLKTTVLSLIAITATASGGCAGGESTATTDSGKKTEASNEPRDMLVVAEALDIDSLNVVLSQHVIDGALLGNIQMGLIESDFDCSLKRAPGYATAWEWSDDGKILKLTLRDDLTWSDGVKVTPEDWKFTYDLIADPSVGSPRNPYAEFIDPAARPKIVDPTHIEFHFTKAYDRDTQVAHIALGLVPKHIYENVDRATMKGHEADKNPLAFGPFALIEYKPGERYVLGPNEKFTGPPEMMPKLKRVMFKIVPEYNTRLLQLKSGDVDYMNGLQITDVDDLKENNPGIRIEDRGYRFMDYIAWNLKNPLFKDKKVRHALAYAADIDAIIAKLLTSKTGEKHAKRTVSNITPELCSVYNDEVAHIPYDMEKAKALLAEAGWKDTNGNGTVDKGGKEFSFTLLTNRENQRRLETSQILQAQFKQIGVQMEISTIEFGALTERAKRRDFEAFLSGWSGALLVDPSDVWESHTKERPREFNYPSYSNPAVDALIAKGLSTPNPVEAAPIWREMQALIYEDQPYLFLFSRNEFVAVDNRFENTNIDILSEFHHLERWSVPEDKVKYKF